MKSEGGRSEGGLLRWRKQLLSNTVFLLLQLMSQ